MIFDPTIHCRCPDCGKQHRRRKVKPVTEYQATLNERNQEIIEAYVSGISVPELSSFHNVSRTTIYNCLHANNTPKYIKPKAPKVIKPKVGQADPVKRFWDSIEQTPDCWLWLGTLSDKGYGIFSLNGKISYAHRLMFELHHKREVKQWVLHKCNNPRCVNPYHLYEGSPADNGKDKKWMNKGINRHQPALDELKGKEQLTNG